MENNKIRILENLDIGIKRDELNYLNKKVSYKTSLNVLILLNSIFYKKDTKI